MAADITQDIDRPLLDHVSLYEDQATTILLIHGAAGSPFMWNHLVPHLQQYHLLIPVLPGHSTEADNGPFSLQISSTTIAKLVREKAHKSRVHAVGLSLGGHVALEFAGRHPELVETVFVSGINLFKPHALSFLLGQLSYPFAKLQDSLPTKVVNWAVEWTEDPEGAEIMKDAPRERPMDFHLHQSVVETLISEREIRALEHRTLIVAATKGGIVPSNDSKSTARKLAEIMKQGNQESRAVEAKSFRHGWCFQVGGGKVFARAIDAWIRNEPLPEELEPLK